jgi:CDP-glucose 4,6-dehydratase
MEGVGLNKNFWRNKKVLITGHTGFKGSWLALWLTELEAQVMGYALAPPTSPNLFTLADVASGMESAIGDINNFKQLRDFFHGSQPDIVIHLAAQSLVRYSYQHPQPTFATNVLGTVNVLEAVRLTPSVQTIINVTSDKCYEVNNIAKNFQETDALGGHDPYSSSKACAELVTQAYRDSYFAAAKVGVATVRAGNVIGGGDWATDRLIPDIMQAYFSGSPLTIRFPSAIRPWQFVLEPLRGYLLLAEKLTQAPQQFAQAWNFGPQQDNLQSVKEVIEHIKKLLEKELVVDTLQESLTETQFLALDSSKAQAALDWIPYWDWATTLRETVGWYKAFQRGENMAVFTREQIRRYELCCHPALVAGSGI